MVQRYIQIPSDLLVAQDNDSKENILTIGEVSGASEPWSVRIVASMFAVP